MGSNAFPVVIAMAMLARRWRIERLTLAVSSVLMVAMCSAAWLGRYVP